VKTTTVWRLVILFALVAGVEALCLGGIIDRITMQPPHQMVLDFIQLLASGSFNASIAKTAGNVFVAFAIAMIVGTALAILLHRWKLLRSILDPLFAAYYAVPVFAFYPLLIIVFGLGELPEIFIGAMLGLVAVIVNVLNGLDRVPMVLLKTARISRMGSFETAFRVTLPFATPYVLTGAKLAVAYSFIGIIGAEFIMSNSGMGYEISFAYTNFDNATMYPLILLILVMSFTINTLLAWWETTLMNRRGLK
jgi:NitT/TauT family transport system permease protein